MALTNIGRDFIAGALSGFETILFDANNSYIGIGDGTAAFDAAQTDLQGTNKVRLRVDAGYPKRDPDNDGSANKLRFRITADGNTANFAWNEWGVFNAATGGVMLNRLVQTQGTKAAGATWVFEVDIEINIGA